MMARADAVKANVITKQEPPMPVENGHRPWNLRALLEPTTTPFSVADYSPRAVIFRQGDPGDSVMHIEKGRVWLAVTARSGKEAICGLVDAGAFLGEEALTGGGERQQTATAMTDTRVLVIAKAHMLRLLHTQTELRDEFIAHLVARNTRLEGNLTEQICYSSEQRLAHLLLVLANCGQGHPHRCALPDVTQEIMSEMVGTTRSRVNALLGKFKKRGFIEEYGGLLHVNPARLRDVDGGARERSVARPPITFPVASRSSTIPGATHAV
jgi:CRP-like cAMP-binding protein